MEFHASGEATFLSPFQSFPIKVKYGFNIVTPGEVLSQSAAMDTHHSQLKVASYFFVP
jgi:hypothetical protein